MKMIRDKKEICLGPCRLLIPPLLYLETKVPLQAKIIREQMRVLCHLPIPLLLCLKMKVPLPKKIVREEKKKCPQEL